MDRFTPLNTLQEQRLLEEDARNVNMGIKYSNVFPLLVNFMYSKHTFDYIQSSGYLSKKT